MIKEDLFGIPFGLHLEIPLYILLVLIK